MFDDRIESKLIIGTAEAAVPIMRRRSFIPGGPEKVTFMTVKLLVGNLPGAITTDELKILFSQAGKVTVADIITNHKNGLSRGFAFVTMGTQPEADKAINMFNSYSINNQKLIVDLFRSTCDF